MSERSATAKVRRHSYHRIDAGFNCNDNPYADRSRYLSYGCALSYGSASACAVYGLHYGAKRFKTHHDADIRSNRHNFIGLGNAPTDYGYGSNQTINR